MTVKYLKKAIKNPSTDDHKTRSAVQSILNDIEKEISNYLSLGYKTTKSNILNEVKIEKGYLLAFCLAIGDGIEADHNKQSPVQWNLLDNIEREIYKFYNPNYYFDITSHYAFKKEAILRHKSQNPQKTGVSDRGVGRLHEQKLHQQSLTSHRRAEGQL